MSDREPVALFRKSDLERLRIAAQRGRPFGAAPWLDQMVRQFGLTSTLRPRGRPRQNNGS